MANYLCRRGRLQSADHQNLGRGKEKILPIRHNQARRPTFARRCCSKLRRLPLPRAAGNFWRAGRQGLILCDSRQTYAEELRERTFDLRGWLAVSKSDGSGEAHDTITASALCGPVAANRCGVRASKWAESPGLSRCSASSNISRRCPDRT